jgi:hypothetical protein
VVIERWKERTRSLNDFSRWLMTRVSRPVTICPW